MFDLGMSELLVIGIIALIVIGPKDLPELFRSLGRFTAKMRGMAREFSRAMEAAADESGVKDVARDLKSATSAKSMGLDAVKDAASKFEKWDPLKNAAKPSPSPKAATPKPDLQPDPQAAPPSQTAPTPDMGPATQALADAKAERQAIVKDVAARLGKAARPEPAQPASAKAAKAPKPAAAKAASAEAPASKKSRAPRKPKSDNSPASKTPPAKTPKAAG